MECLAGIDIGTTSTRLAIYGVDGALYSEAVSPHKISHPRLGWAEQDAKVWWEDVIKTSVIALKNFSISLIQVSTFSGSTSPAKLGGFCLINLSNKSIARKSLNLSFHASSLA